MRKGFLLILLAFGLCACSETPNERIFTDEMDVFFPEDPEWEYISGQFVTGEPVMADLMLKVANCYDRTVTVRVSETDGIYLPETAVRLSAGPSISEIRLPLCGEVTLEEPRTSTIIAEVVFDEGKTISQEIPVSIVSNPPFAFVLDAGQKVVSSSSAYRDDYAYSVLGTAYSDTEPVFIELSYINGYGKSVSLEDYSIETLDGTDPQEALTLTLESDELVEGAAESVIRLKLCGTFAQRSTFIVKDLKIKVGDELYCADNENASFPEIKFRIFDIMHEHVIGTGANDRVLIGYDKVKVTGPDGVEREWLSPMLGVTVATRAPFMYQWGRKEDGHQVCYSNAASDKSATTDIKSNNPEADPNLAGKFILAPDKLSWQTTPDVTDALWDDSETGGVNNPCPPGYRVPTSTEVDPAGLNLMEGFEPVGLPGRRAQNGTFGLANHFIWTSTPNASNAGQATWYVITTKSVSATNPRANGAAVRCININK